MEPATPFLVATWQLGHQSLSSSSSLASEATGGPCWMYFLVKPKVEKDPTLWVSAVWPQTGCREMQTPGLEFAGTALPAGAQRSLFQRTSDSPSSEVC